MTLEVRETDSFLEDVLHTQFKSKVTAPKNPKLIREPKKVKKLTPSEFLKEISMNTKEKLASTHEMYIPQIIELLDMGETSLQKNTTLPVDEPMFQPFPSEIYFQKYDKFNTYEVPLLLRNNDKVPRLVKVSQIDTPYFKIISPADSHHKVGPGLSITFVIQFTPEENKDYTHEIIVNSEREKYVIPIKCIGARAILDFPDEINFSTNAVKFLNTKVLLVRNIGNKDAKFSLSVEKPFEVTPDHGILPIGENMQVKIEFQPLKCGDYFKELKICYDSNETIYSKLYGVAQDVNVRLDKNSLRIEDTYITMTNQRTITIHNRSDIIVHYEWKKYATLEEEEQQKLKTISTLSREEENAKNKISDQSSDYMALLSRNFKNKVKHAQGNTYFFEDEVFFLQPIEGDIWPNSSTDVNIIFKPDFAQLYNRVAFCEIIGRESRLPLRLCGLGAGPKVQLSIEILDVGNIFIGSTHVYEVVMSNRGFIDAIYSITIPNTAFGKCFTFEPNESLISPNGFQVIRITFKSNKLGECKETFEFTIDGNPEKCPLVISGNIIAPTFNFDIPKIKFGLVSFGFKHSQTCYLSNTSLVPMKFSLRALSDSEATRSFDGNFNSFDISNFKEFSIIPKSGMIAPQSEIKILVEFIPHFIKKYETSLAVDIEDVGDEFYLLPITARSTVPTISLLTSTVDIGRCFIYHKYIKSIKLSNDTSLAARYFIMPSHSDNPFKFQSVQSEGIIDAHSIKEIIVNIEALRLGYITGDLYIKINGSVEQPLKCNFTSLCQGPVIHIVEKEIDWGLTPLLQEVSKDILISNESLISAKYTTNMAEKNSPWKIVPSEGVIEPGSEFVIKAICHLADKRKYTDTIVINVEHSFPKEIKVKAQGLGSSVVSEPNIGNLIDFGTFFSNGNVKKVFHLTNKSSRTHNLSFHPEGRNVTSINKKEMAKEKELPPLMFKINPNRVDLLPGETKEILIEGFSDKAQLIEEWYTCQAIIGKSSGKDRIMKFKIRCEFIEPLVSFSKKEIEFRCERDGLELPKNQLGNIVISNISSLSLNSRINTDYPFTILNEETDEFTSEIFVKINTGENKKLNINFDPSFKKDFHNETVNGQLTVNYIEHQHTDYVSLKADIYYPNIQLESNYVDFECILNNTESVRYINMANIGPLPVNYKWSFVIDELTVIERINGNKFIQKSIIYAEEKPIENDEIITEVISNENAEKDAVKNKEEEIRPETQGTNTESDMAININQTKEVSKKNFNQKLEHLVSHDNLADLPSYEEIFDISPIYGSLNPGDSQQLTVTFFGHKEIRAIVKAVCQIENGPEYEMILKGEASILSYEISSHFLDLAHIPYDQTTDATILVKNTGKVRLQFNEIILGEPNDELSKPFLIPATGSIEPDSEQLITIKYLPGIPQKFNKKVLLQIAHFPPDEIIIQGEASFADLVLDLPRFESAEYKTLLHRVKGANYKKVDKPKIEVETSQLRLLASSPDFQGEAEIDRMAIETFVKNQNHPEISGEVENLKTEVNISFDELIDSPHISSMPQANQSPKSSPIQRANSKTKTRPHLPDYLLDFGHVILGTVKTHVIRAVNMGEISASFEIERQNFSRTGFLIDVERVKNLPNQESIEFLVTFDPRGANLPLGSVEHIIPINVINGPIIQLRLIANVTMPDLQISNDVIEFNEVKCGECKIITVQIHNHKEVKCDWSASYVPNKDDKFTPLHLKRKKKVTGEPSKPHIFEIMPPSGTMLPGQKLNIQIKFMPIEEKPYEERVTIRMAQSSQRLMVLCKGRGLEPRIELSKTLLEFEPILPHSVGDEQEVKIINPCQFPIEIYSLEFDKNYLDEEKVLRTIRGYDEYNTILLPPRNAAEKLPVELQEYYEEQMKKIEEEERKKAEENLEELKNDVEHTEPNNLPNTVVNAATKTQESPGVSSRGPQSHPMSASFDGDKHKEKFSDEKKPLAPENGGELEKNPVYESIARYLGIDLSVEGRAARNRRGVAIIVHGAPLTGKTKAATVLAKHYDCPLLTIDSIITDAIANSKSTSAARARQLCAEAATKHAEEQRALDAIAQQNAAANAGTVNSTGLSAEALAQHSLKDGSQAMSKKTSVAGDSHTKSKKKADVSDVVPQQPTSPLPQLQPISRKLSITTFSGDDGYMSVVLSEEIVVDILNERFQLPDCQRGIIIDGLDTLFLQNNLHAATSILKAFNNRRYIYCFTLKSDFQKYKEEMNKIHEEKMKLKKEKEEQERIELEEMDDEAYENMPEEKKREIDVKLLHAKKLRLKREAEEKAAEMERREKELAELAKIEEEKKKQKKKPGITPSAPPDKKAVVPPPAPVAPAKPVPPPAGKDTKSSLQIPNNQSGDVRPHTRSDNPAEEADKSKRKRLDSISKSGPEEESKEKIVDPEEEKRKEIERQIHTKYKTFELFFKDVSSLFDSWDRTQGTIYRQPSPSEKSDHDDVHVKKTLKKQPDKKNTKDKSDEKAKEKEKEKENHKQKDEQKDHQQPDETVDNETTQNPNSLTEEKKEDGIGITHIIYDNNNKVNIEEIYKHSRLPQLSEVLDGMGLGPRGPPVPPPAIFSVIPFPAQRKAPPCVEFGHYIFVSNIENDPNLIPDEKPKELVAPTETQVEEDKPPEPSGSKLEKGKKGGGRGSRSESKTESAVGPRKTSGDNKKKDTKTRRESSTQSPVNDSKYNQSENADGINSIDGSALEKPSQKLQRFRWIIPSQGELVIRLRFTSEEPGQYDQTLNFEIVGTRRRYQLFCRGICAFPTISREPRIVFTNRKKYRTKTEIVSHKFIVSEDIFEFGPLLVGSNRDRLKEGKFPEYQETITICNSSPMDSEVNFCFLEDSVDKLDLCFFVEQTDMVLKPNETKQLKIFATPKEIRHYEDSLICCIKENPEPVIFRFSCHGQKPELQLDKKEFLFKQVLLHRKDSRDIKMTNTTMIPVQWRLEGVDLLGDEFVCNQTNGIIEPNNSFTLLLHFRALKPLNITAKDKKNLKLLVSDVNGFLGFMENHTIAITAEAYDVALEINLPKGNDGGLEFGTIRVNSENKQVCNLKNKGKYNIKYNFIVEPTGPESEEILNCLTIIPANGELQSIHDRNAQQHQIQVIVNTKKEITVKDLPIIKCQITEPQATSEGCVIANIPIKISFKAVFTKFNIIPQSDINFGVLNVNAKRQEKIIIENKGDFDFKFSITKYIRESVKLTKAPTKDEKNNKQREGSSQTKTTTKRNDSVRDGGGGGQVQGRLQYGIFAITPGFGYILPGGHQAITIDCLPESIGKQEEEMVISITDADVSLLSCPSGMIYKLTAEATIPNITISPDIFEEHTIIPNISVLDHKTMGIGIYCEEENRFLFNNVIVSRTAKARFKLYNSNKIPIDLALALRSSNRNVKSVNELVFDIEPQRVQVPPFCCSYATVSFTPQAITSYTSLFEATLESTSSHSKNKSISFEITGEGNLPRFSVVKPSIRNKKGQYLMLFKRNVVNHVDYQNLILANEGTLAAKINFSLNDPDSVFKIKANNLDKDIDANEVVFKDNGEAVSSIVLQPGQKISFIVSFSPVMVQNYEGILQLTVTDNQFEDTLIQFIGEGYMEDVTLDNLHSINNIEYEDEIMADEDVSAIKGNSINFGDIYVNESRQLLFTMTNRHKQICYRFEWPENQNITFSPRVGHLHANCAKDVSITFKASDSKYMKNESINCSLTKIMFDVSTNEVKDWDDRMTIIKWVNEVITSQVAPSEVYRPSSGTTSITTSLPTKSQTIKKKVTDTEPEPHYIKLEENLSLLELVVSAKCDYSRYKCSSHVAKFKDTLMFQTRVYEVSIINRGKIQFNYNWKVAMEDRRRPFTPLVQPDTPTPEPSPSPRGRKKKDKESVETSASPPRKPIKDTKDSKDAKKDAKDPKDPKGAAVGKKPSEKVPEKVEKLDDTIKSVKGGKKGKEKDGKDADEPRKETSTNLEMADTARDDNLRAESQAQMRAESALSYQAPSIMSESGYVPFSVEPAFGKLEPGKTQLFKIKFAPLDCNDYQARLTCLIPNLEDGKQGPVVAVKGRGLLPYCHFDLEESDYITAGRRDPERPGPGGDISNVGLDNMTKVIEFKSVGLFTKCVKQFDIVNPTNIDYEYEWVREDPNNIQQAEMFSCINERGFLKSGRRQEIIFEFTPNDFGTHESFWKFKSAKYNLEIPFLLIGDVSKPKVVFDRSHVLFKPLLIGMLGHETVNIINQENKPFEFKFDTNSCYTEGRSEVVLIEPCNGTVGALSRIPVKLSLKPRDQRQLVFNLKCMLSNSSKPMLLNVKGEGFSMQTTLYCEDNIGNKVEFGEGNINEIHFGEVEKNEIAFRNLYILNVGKFKIDFDCYLTSEIDESLSCFSIEPQKVSVDPGQKQQCVLKYHAKKERPSISNLVIKVDHGAVYHIHIDGIAVRPDVQFSFYEYNFGPCFIYKAGMPVQSIKLNILNAGSKETNVDCLFNNSSVNSCFLIDFKQTILMPKESTTMSISFIPRECMKYEEKVLFELNGLTRREICLKGVGTDMRIELVDSKQKLLDVGTLEVSKSSKKVVKIVNKSVASIEFNLLFEPKSEILIENKQILQISPYQGIKLKPNQVLDLQVTFKPKSRIPKFYEEIKLEYNGICTPLFAINGACHGYNIWMDSNALPFGAVVQKCSTTKRVVMHNEGDIGACFKWEVDRLKPDFSIEPTHGYISPGMDVSFDITFSPQELSADIRKDNIKCILEGCPALAITLTGSCILSVPQKEVQYFDTFARQKESKQINIQNKTNSIWEIKPVIEGEYFSGIESITVEPQSIKAYDIVYSPLSMTLEGKKHLGTCFFPLPDGTGLSYNLIGTSGSPKASGRITRDVPCKLQTTEVLLIENWLKKPQRFKIIYEFIKPDKPDPSTTIKGHDYIDVPGNGKKEYKLSYFAHKEGITQVKVIFKNEQTLEYLFYELSLKAVKGGSIGTIDLVTPVRVSTQYSLKMENPLPTAVNFTLTCTNNTEVLIPTNVQIVAKGQGDINIEYLPLKVGEMAAKLELTSTDLGVCTYDLNLKALPTQNEKPLQFKTTIGTAQTITAKFTNFCKQRTDYICKIDNPDFKADKSITAAPSQTPSGIEVTFDITFEPSNLGEIKSTLILSSPLGGDYVFPLFGSSQVPKPQGPYIIKANGNTSISFKNVFASQLQYTFAIDNPLFYVTKATDTIKPHQSYKIIVGFDGNDTANKADVMGKLIVSPPKITGLTTNVQWIYYLKGVTA